MEQNIFLEKYFKTIYYLYKPKNTLNILMTLLELTRGYLLQYQKKMLKK